MKRFGEGKSNRLKTVLVGLAEAGKTTVVRHFTGGTVPNRLDRTVGIEITPDWRPLIEGPLQVNIWDFAGQADYYSSHQLFLTKGALFLLVVDLHAFSKEVESGVDNYTDPRRRIFWWLEMLHMQVPGAAIALVGSHVDDMEQEGVDVDLAGSRLYTGEALRFFRRPCLIVLDWESRAIGVALQAHMMTRYARRKKFSLLPQSMHGWKLSKLFTLREGEDRKILRVESEEWTTCEDGAKRLVESFKKQ